MVTDDEVLVRTAANRRLLADFFESLDEAQLDRPSLCGEWTVRQVLAHLTMPWTAGPTVMGPAMLKARGSFHRASAAVAAQVARRPVPELVGVLRDHAESRFAPPGVGVMGQMTDGCVHLRDCARPLGLDTDVTLEDWRLVLDFLPSRRALLGFVPRGRFAGLRLAASDQDWSHGDGAEVRGPSEALALGLLGREVALGDLAGPGVERLRARLS